jgi:hypothetical protein
MTGIANGSRWFFAHDRLLSQLLEDSFQIAWEYLERSGELGDGASASRFLSGVIETMIRRRQRSRLALSNRAISAYHVSARPVPQDQKGRVLPPEASPHRTWKSGITKCQQTTEIWSTG